jgi:hypothetical protein
MLAMSDGTIFAIGSVILIAVFTAALGLAYARFEEMGRTNVAPTRAERGTSPSGPSA